jgi:hypothetical protein
MSEQQSQKRGVKSDAQKQADARNSYDPIPATSPAAGAFGAQRPATQTDEDLALAQEEKRMRRENQRSD